MMRSLPTTTYVHTDGLRSPVAETNASGVVTSSTRYEPYGTVYGSSVAPVQGPGYTGHVRDVDTGLSYMQQRYYDPLAGRFLSVDPIEANAASFNRYWYANNNPYKYIDPDGRCPNCITAGVGAGVGFLVGIGVESYKQFSSGELSARSLVVEAGKGAVVGGLVGLTGGATAGMSLSAQVASTGSVALGVGAGAHSVGEVAKGNLAPSTVESLAVGMATAAGAVVGTSIAPLTSSLTTTVVPAVSSNPVTSISGKVFNTVNIPAETITRPAAAETLNSVAGALVEEGVKRK